MGGMGMNIDKHHNFVVFIHNMIRLVSFYVYKDNLDPSSTNENHNKKLGSIVAS